VKDKFIY